MGRRRRSDDTRRMSVRAEARRRTGSRGRGRAGLQFGAWAGQGGVRSREALPRVEGAGETREGGEAPRGGSSAVGAAHYGCWIRQPR